MSEASMNSNIVPWSEIVGAVSCSWMLDIRGDASGDDTGGIV